MFCRFFPCLVQCQIKNQSKPAHVMRNGIRCLETSLYHPSSFHLPFFPPSGNIYLESLSPDSLGTITENKIIPLEQTVPLSIDTCLNFELKLLVPGVRTTEAHQHLKSAIWCRLITRKDVQTNSQQEKASTKR